MEDKKEERKHLLTVDSQSPSSCTSSYSSSVEDVANNTDTTSGLSEIKQMPLFFKSMENFSAFHHCSIEKNSLISKSSSHISNLDYADVNFHHDIKKDSRKKVGRPNQLLCETVSTTQPGEKCYCFEDSSCSGGTPTIHMQHKNGQVFMLDSSPNNSLSRTFTYVQTKYETSHSSEVDICRICHSTGDEKLIAPCKCSGSTRYVHASCLVTWFKKSVKHQCELCKSDVKVRKINHKIALWRKPEDRPVPLIWFSVFFVGLFLNVLSIYVNASEYCKSTACLIFYVVNGFGIILDAAFLWFWFLKCRHYWKKWCALNQDWFIDEATNEQTNNTITLQYVQGGCPV